MNDRAPTYWTTVAARMPGANASTPEYDRCTADLNHLIETHAILRMIHRYLVPRAPLRTLDVGAGLGRFTELAARFGSVDALEPSGLAEPLRDRFREAQHVRVIEKTISDFIPPAERYNLIVVSGVFMEMSDEAVRMAVRKLAACLAPGGLFLIRDMVSPKAAKSHGHAPYVYYSRPPAFWHDLLQAEQLRIRCWRYCHMPYLTRLCAVRAPACQWIAQLLYARVFHRVHLLINELTAPFWDTLLRAGGRSRMALLCAMPTDGGAAPAEPCRSCAWPLIAPCRWARSPERTP